MHSIQILKNMENKVVMHWKKYSQDQNWITMNKYPNGIRILTNDDISPGHLISIKDMEPKKMDHRFKQQIRRGVIASHTRIKDDNVFEELMVDVSNGLSEWYS